MIQAELKQCEKLVLDNSNSVWNSVKQAETVVARLSTVVVAFSSRNRQLRSLHFDVGLQVNELMNAPMLPSAKQRDHNKLKENELGKHSASEEAGVDTAVKAPLSLQWLERVAKLRKVFLDADETVGHKHATKTWKEHWDQQFYKAFALQYRASLADLSGNQPLVNIELVFNASSGLGFRPPLEALRTQYFDSLAGFLEQPTLFRGFADPPLESLYASIPERNVDEIQELYRHGETQLALLQRFLKSLQPWVVLGSVDLDEFVATNLKEIADWQRNFLMLEKRRRQLADLPDSKKIACYEISMTPFKSAVVEQIHRLSDALVISLRNSAEDDVKIIDDFLSESISLVSSRPTNAKEVADVARRINESLAKYDQHRALLDRIFEKNELLKDMVNISMELADLRPRWESYEVAKQSFGSILKDQKQFIMVEIDRKMKESQVNASRFITRWDANKPQVAPGEQLTEALAQKIIQSLADWELQVADLNFQAEEIKADCSIFRLAVPDFSHLVHATEAISMQKESWKLYVS
jgi:dynein heavy chain 2